jgi:hypothetical protein
MVALLVWVWVCVSVIDGLLLAACSINDCICCCKHSFLLNGKRAKARFLEKKNTLIDERLFAIGRFLHPHPWLVGNVLHCCYHALQPLRSVSVRPFHPGIMHPMASLFPRSTMSFHRWRRSRHLYTDPQHVNLGLLFSATAIASFGIYTCNMVLCKAWFRPYSVLAPKLYIISHRIFNICIKY